MMSGNPHVLFLFLDGVGIGNEDPATNPFFAAELKAVRHLLGGKMLHQGDSKLSTSMMSLVPIDATLGVPGLPQSGTGQTSLFTGIDAARIVGRHFGPYPHSTLKPVIEKHNIFSQLARSGKTSYYANAFPQQFFDHVNSRRTRITATTLSWICSGGVLNDGSVLAAGSALSADITNVRWPTLGYPQIPAISPQTAGRRFVELARRFDFVLFEYYLTDHAGHAQSMEEAIKVLETLDGLVEGVMKNIDLDTMLFIVASDHGNIEDLSTKSHTRNPVPLLAVGAKHHELTAQSSELTDITPALLHIMR